MPYTNKLNGLKVREIQPLDLYSTSELIVELDRRFDKGFVFIGNKSGKIEGVCDSETHVDTSEEDLGSVQELLIDGVSFLKNEGWE